MFEVLNLQIILSFFMAIIALAGVWWFLELRIGGYFGLATLLIVVMVVVKIALTWQ